MDDHELIETINENQGLITEQLTLMARAIDEFEARLQLFQTLLLHDPPHSHKDPLPYVALKQTQRSAQHPVDLSGGGE